MNAIVNVDAEWGIGKKGDLLFPIPEDMKFFREMTTGKTIVLGRKTLETFPGMRPLKNRRNIVLSRQKDFAPEGVTVCATLEDLKREIAGIPSEEVFVVGGDSIYKQLLPYCATALVTRVQAEKEADSYFPNLEEEPGWQLAAASELHTYEGVGYRFCVYRNKDVKML